jgi:hypothetical protein
MTCLSEEARGSSQGHRYLRQVQTENKKLLFVSCCTKNYSILGTGTVLYLGKEMDVFFAPKRGETRLVFKNPCETKPQ